MADLVIAAPLKGWASALEEVPDAVFAERMMGDGLAIDPLASALHAPFDGEIASLPQTGHAIVVRSEAGVEMLMHVGLETVALGGEGFMAHVCEGQRVKAGDRLLTFDLDLLAQRAKSLITPIILTNGDRFDVVRRLQDRQVEVGDALMVVRPRVASGTAEAGAGAAQLSARVAFDHGLHARPAATVARAAQRFAAEISVSLNGRRANAKSPVSLMTLGAGQRDAVAIEAHGADAAGAARAVAAALETPSAPQKLMSPVRAAAAQPGRIAGVRAAPGLALGVAVHFHAPEIAVAEHGQGAAIEGAALQRALVVVKARLQAAALGDASRSAILDAHAVLLDDPDLAAEAARLVAANKSAGFAWKRAIATQAQALARLDDPYMKERIADLRDLELQVLTALGGAPAAPALALPERAIVLAEDILPSQFVALDRAKLAGLATATGGPTSHVALLAAAAGVPAITAAGPELLDVAEGTEMLLDADAGVLRIKPSAEETRAAKAEGEKRQAASLAARAHAQEECRTVDGVRILVYANLASVAEAQTVLEQGAEGCGLLRTEFLFMDRDAPPSVEEQRAAYQAIADALAGRPLAVRTLDAAPDKPVAYLASAHEENPALGLRGLRASLRRPELLRGQLAAIAAVTGGPARVLLPMVTDISEVKAVRAMLGELGARLELGAMIETPAAALLSDQLAEVLDFLSLGTNDLSQYALAMDRGNPALAAAIDALHPAVLRLIRATIEGARKHGKPVSVCGAAASDLDAAPILIGLGVTALSAAPAAIPALKARLRQFSLADCTRAAEAALACPDAAQVRELSRQMRGAS